MKRYILTWVGVLMALTTFAQTVLIVETDEETQKYYYNNSAAISFWGQPQGEERNGDLTLTITTVKSQSISFVMKATRRDLFTIGFYISEEEGQWDTENTTYCQEQWDDERGNYVVGSELKDDSHRYVIREGFDENDECVLIITGLKHNTTYYIKPFAMFRDESVVFGSEKTATTLWTRQDILLNQGDWYIKWCAENGRMANYYMPIIPTEEAWLALCKKYQDYFGKEPTDAIKSALITQWFRHLTPAEATLMMEHTVAYYNNCEGGDVYVIDKVCDEMIPNLLKAASNINLMNPNLEMDKDGRAYYTRYCNVSSVSCDASYGIEGDSYVKAEPINQSANPQVAYDFPFLLLPNRIYNVSITIAPNTEDEEEKLPNRFYVYVKNWDNEKAAKIANPETSTEEETNYYFEGGGQKLETITFQIDTHKDEFAAPQMIWIYSQVTSRQRDLYSRTLRIAKISIAPEMEDAVPGDVDMDGTLNLDDVQTVATNVVLSEEKTEEVPEEKPSTDFTGDGKTLIDDIVALVNFIQTGQFKPSSSKVRARYAPAKAPAFTTPKSLTITAGESTTMSVDMSGMADYTAVSFDIKVPQGVQIAIDQNGKPEVTLGSIATAKHKVKVATQMDGQIITVACYAEDNACFTKDTGAIITVGLTADTATTPTDQAEISLANCMATKTDLSSAMLDEYTINAGIVNGIEDLRNTNSTTSLSIVAYYTLNGSKISRPQKGINLVRMSDGSVKKLLVK